nr:hypothetical protein [Tanacetum cinerariifolium]
MTGYPEISKRVRDKYHNLKHDKMVKSIFNSRKNKAGVGIKIPSWMITDEMKLTKNYQMTTSALRPPNPNVNEGELSAQQKSTIISIRIPPRCIAEQKIRDDLEAKQNVEKVKEHLVAEEIEKMVEGMKSGDENEADNSILNSQNDPGTRLDPESYKESLEVEKIAVVQPVNVIEKEDESVKDDYELRRRVKGNNVEESRNTSSSTPIRSPRIHSTLIYLDIEKLQELMNQADVVKMIADAIQQEHGNLRANITLQIKNAITNHIPSQDDPHDDAHPKGENSAKRQKTSEHGTYVFRESSFGQVYKSKPGPEKFILSLHKFSAVIFPGEDIEERIPPDGQKELGKPKEEVYSNSKIVQVIKTTGELRHEHKFVTEIIARRANGSIVSITEPDYKNLNKNDIKDISTMISEIVHDFQLGVESYQQKVNLTAPTITFPGIEKKKMFSIINEPMYGIIYKNNKKEKRVMGHEEIHKSVMLH